MKPQTCLAMAPLAFSLSLACATDEAKTEDKLNVVFIEVDDLHYNCTGYMGNKVVKTPHLDKLASQGTVFTNCIVQGVACAPSRNSLITGSYPHNTGIYLNQSIPSLKKDSWTFPKALKTAGIHTALVGKNHFRAHGFKVESDESIATKNAIIAKELGFEYILSTIGKVGLYKNEVVAESDPYAKYLHGKGNYQKLVKAYNKKPSFPLDSEDYLDCFIRRQAIKFIKTQKKSETPFFLWVDFTLPHPPMDAPAKYRGMYDNVEMPTLIPASPEGLPKSMTKSMRKKTKPSYLKGYYELVTMMDDQVGEIIKSIDESGLKNNTMIVFFSDHGSMIGNHGLYAKKYLYKDVLNSPLIISHPTLAKGKRVTNCVELVDLSKTMLDLYGVPKEDIQKSHGESLLPFFTNQGQYPDEYAFAEHNDAVMIQNEQFKYIRFKNDIDVLFDLKNDPEEMNNAVKQHPELVKKLSTKIDEWLKRTGPVEPHIEK